jgi:vancomycin resistance protein VanJ
LGGHPFSGDSGCQTEAVQVTPPRVERAMRTRRRATNTDWRGRAALRRPVRWRLTVAVASYAALAALLPIVTLLTDLAWPATLVAYGPRWLTALPLVPLVPMVAMAKWDRSALRLLGILALSGLVLLFGFLDFRLGLFRGSGPRALRIMTHNLGAGHVTAETLDRLLRTEQVDIAALQECPFYDLSIARFGWHFYYGGNLCVVSRFPFTVLDEPDPENVWRRGGREPLRFAIDTPVGRIQLLNVHFQTIRGGLQALAAGWPRLSGFESNRETARMDSRAAREKTTRGAEPLVVAGDFNLPSESAIYRASWGDLDNAFSSCGRGFGHTKFTRLFGIRIDHVLTSHQWACTDARVLNSPYGGDHAPLIVDLQFR